MTISSPAAHDEHGHRRPRRRDPLVVLRVGDDVERDAEVRQARADRGAQQRRALARAGGEDERVEPAQRGRHRGDGGADAAHEHVERELRALVAVDRRALDLAPSRRGRRCRASPSGDAAPRRAPARRRRGAAGAAAAQGRSSPSASPSGTPSSGVRPMVVSTERPSSTAVTEQPLPRWQTTSRPQRSAPRIRAACSWHHATLSPWKPKRRRPWRSVHARGSA